MWSSHQVGEISRYQQTWRRRTRLWGVTKRRQLTQQTTSYGNQLQGRGNKLVPESPDEWLQESTTGPLQSGLKYVPAMYYGDVYAMTRHMTVITGFSRLREISDLDILDLLINDNLDILRGRSRRVAWQKRNLVLIARPGGGKERRMACDGFPIILLFVCHGSFIVRSCCPIVQQLVFASQ